MEQEIKICQNCQKEFTIEPEDFDFYVKIKVPPPTWCPECRMIRRMMFRNERSLYRRKCDATGKEIISIYSPDKPFRVYDQKYWWSDNWDTMEYGRDYDFNKPFFQQFKTLDLEVPKISLWQKNNINSPWVNGENNSKNCYLNVGGIQNEDCAYNTYALWCKDVFDNYIILKSELSYGNIFCRNCYKVFFSQFCFDCHDTYFSFNCRGCSNIIGCTNLKNKSYYIFNKPVSKEEYKNFFKKYHFGSQSTINFLKNEFEKIKISNFHKFNFSIMAIDCIGDFIENSKNCKFCFNLEKAENTRYVYVGGWIRDCYDVTSIGPNNQLSYEFVNGGGDCSNLLFSEACSPNCYNLYYCKDIEDSSNLFGCIGLRNKSYCILNKQYTKEDYERLMPKIIEHMNEMPYISKIQKSNIKNQNDNQKLKNERNSKTKEIVYRYGEFFSPELSPFAYNETIAQEYFPLTKEEAIEQGYKWKEPEERNIKPDIKTEELPDHIKNVDDSIIGKVIQCGHTKIKKDGTLGATCNEQCITAFKIIEPELQFYKRMNLPLPRLCPNCRHYQRIKQRNPLKLWHRKCQCAGERSENGVYTNTIEHFHGKEPCPNEFETTYSPDRPEIVYCEKCYLAEVV